MNRKKVMIVEDDFHILCVMEEILSEAHDVVTAQSARDFFKVLDELEEQKPDLIIFDINLPDTDGDVLTFQLKKSSDRQHIPILLISSSEELANKAYLSGADGYLHKPFNITDLVEKVASFI